jgi:hypothetical protein
VGGIAAIIGAVAALVGAIAALIKVTQKPDEPKNPPRVNS